MARKTTKTYKPVSFIDKTYTQVELPFAMLDVASIVLRGIAIITDSYTMPLSISFVHSNENGKLECIWATDIVPGENPTNPVWIAWDNTNPKDVAIYGFKDAHETDAHIDATHRIRRARQLHRKDAQAYNATFNADGTYRIDSMSW